MSQHAKQFKKKEKKRRKNLTDLSDPSAATQFGRQFLRPKSESKNPHFPRQFYSAHHH
jgi:hypothetical protein